MRFLLYFWAGPLAFFWGWYFLSLNDVNFGTILLSRRLHDLVFEVYGQILGVSPDSVPKMAAEACLFDTFLVVALLAVRHRRALWRHAVRLRKTFSGSTSSEAPEGDPARPAE